jgi:hypothetical protein
VSSSLVRFGCIALQWSAGSEVLEKSDLSQVALLNLQRFAITGLDIIRAKHVRWLSEGQQQVGTFAQLQSLTCNRQSIGDEGAKVLAQLLPHCRRLTFLCLPQCNIGEEGCETLTSVLAGHPSIRQLSLSDNPIRTRGLVALLPAIQHQLVKVWMYHCDIIDSDFTLLLNALTERVKFINCNGNPDVHPELHQSSIAELRKKLPELTLLV